MDNTEELLKEIDKVEFKDYVPEALDYLPHNVVTKLKEKHLSITAAESLTSGMFQSTLTQVPGASQVFSGGFVTYSDDVKSQFLGIDPKLIEKYTVVSGPVAEAMARFSAKVVKSDIGVGLTGVAGPDALEGNPVGTVFIGAFNQSSNKLEVKEFHFSGDRNSIRLKSTLAAFALVEEII
ncbi:nicotinamide-nucleotide amidohydrolase family protein [Companilactobacillus kedongensis]|uniref:nicotinamide-nucleotide amidohydrolase family protein n=1 Tax=Companilactobacillus kedongensis TaxID=2486004 RepID=UPI000F776499|nr:nicotinamide-nucleotide amidohydrolase family protein [Companilactobacillus kedongensis]